MNTFKRLFLTLSMLCLMLSVHAADVYPSKLIKLVVPYPAGGGADAFSRPLAQQLSNRLGQSVVVENRGGAGGNISMESVARAPSDGYTLMLALTPQLAINGALYEKIPYDPIKSFTPISLIAEGPYLLLVNPSLPVNNLKEFLAFAKSENGKLTYASSGSGSGGHMAAELLISMTNIPMTHIPYKGASASIVDLLSGRIQLVFATMPSVMNHVRSTKLRGIAVTSTQRSPLVPQLPTVAEAGLPGFQSGTWQGILVPRFTPPAVISTLHREIAYSMQTAEIKQKVESEGGMVVANTPQVFALWLRDEVAKWAKVVKAAHIVLE